jgi:hypothetical protein
MDTIVVHVQDIKAKCSLNYMFKTLKQSVV